MARGRSTSARVDAAFRRVVQAQRVFGFPKWRTSAEAERGFSSMEFMTMVDEAKDRDPIREDMRLVIQELRVFPWESEARVPKPKPRKGT